MNNPSPRIYVASLSDYSAGRLHGRWINATQDPSDIFAEVVAMLAESVEPGAEEWAIHDYEGFYDVRLSEQEHFTRVSAIANLIEKNGPAFAAWLENEGGGGDSDEWADAFADDYQGTYDTTAAFAEELVGAIGWPGLEGSQLAELWPFIDFEAIARELCLEGDVYFAGASPYGVHAFRNN